MFLTILKLNLYFQVLSEQVHHYRLHVTSDAAAISVGDKTVWSNTKRIQYWTKYNTKIDPSTGSVKQG